MKSKTRRSGLLTWLLFSIFLTLHHTCWALCPNLNLDQDEHANQFVDDLSHRTSLDTFLSEAESEKFYQLSLATRNELQNSMKAFLKRFSDLYKKRERNGDHSWNIFFNDLERSPEFKKYGFRVNRDRFCEGLERKRLSYDPNAKSQGPDQDCPPEKKPFEKLDQAAKESQKVAAKMGTQTSAYRQNPKLAEYVDSGKSEDVIKKIVGFAVQKGYQDDSSCMYRGYLAILDEYKRQNPFERQGLRGTINNDHLEKQNLIECLSVFKVAVGKKDAPQEGQPIFEMTKDPKEVERGLLNSISSKCFGKRKVQIANGEKQEISHKQILAQVFANTFFTSDEMKCSQDRPLVDQFLEYDPEALKKKSKESKKQAEKDAKQAEKERKKAEKEQKKAEKQKK